MNSVLVAMENLLSSLGFRCDFLCQKLRCLRNLISVSEQVDCCQYFPELLWEEFKHIQWDSFDLGERSARLIEEELL